MKISGIKVNVSAELGELDLDIKDIIDVKRLDWEQRKEIRRECHECEREKRVAQGGPSDKTRDFVEAVVNKAVQSIKDQIMNQLAGKKPKGKDAGPDDE